MNTYGKFAQDTWKMLAPTRYALIPDPEAWFQKLGEEAEMSVGELSVQIAGSDPQGETYLEKVGRLNAAKMQAEEIVRAEMLTPETVEESEDDHIGTDSRDAHLEGTKEMNRIYRESLEEMHREEMERDLNR